MKTKYIIGLVAVAIVTLSFTFATSKKTLPVSQVEKTTSAPVSEPVGGFVSEDPIQ